MLSVNVLDDVHQSLKRSIPLTKPIEFLIQHKPFKRVRKRKCTYWEFKYAKGRVLLTLYCNFIDELKSVWVI